jgi:hypothetical protein
VRLKPAAMAAWLVVLAALWWAKCGAEVLRAERHHARAIDPSAHDGGPVRLGAAPF